MSDELPVSFFGSVRKSGTSVVVTIPPAVLKLEEIELGDIIQVNIMKIDRKKKEE